MTIAKALLKLRARDEVSAEEERVLHAAIGEVREIAARKVVVRADTDLSESLLLIDGLMCRFKDLRDGSRMISELHIPGDFLDLHSFTLKRLDHNVLTLSPSSVAVVPHDRLIEITERHAHLTRLLWLSTNLDAANHRETAVSLGRRSALARTAHLLCELHARFSVVGMVERDSYRLPITQIDLAECLGLTSVHINRMLKQLRELGLVSFRDGLVSIHDLAGLQRHAEFDPGYLRIEHRPR